MYPSLVSRLASLWRWGGALAGACVLLSAGGPAAEPARPPQQLAARQQLGRLLFFEPALSVNGKRSCASCHRPEKAFCDQRTVPRALRFTANLDRNTPTLLNAAGQATFFHDGRAGSLAEVLTAVLTSEREFGSSYALVSARLNDSPAYRAWFRRAFGPGAAAGPATLAAALTAYLQTLNRQNSLYDRARRGEEVLDSAAQAGARLFARELGCAGCHAGLLFRDGQRHEVRPSYWLKTPGLRNVALTMPYGAEGQYASVAQVLASGFHRSRLPRPLSGTDGVALDAFLTTLTDTTGAGRSRPAELPALPALPDRVPGGLY